MNAPFDIEDLTIKVLHGLDDDYKELAHAIQARDIAISLRNSMRSSSIMKLILILIGIHKSLFRQLLTLFLDLLPLYADNLIHLLWFIHPKVLVPLVHGPLDHSFLKHCVSMPLGDSHAVDSSPICSFNPCPVPSVVHHLVLAESPPVEPLLAEPSPAVPATAIAPHAPAPLVQPAPSTNTHPMVTHSKNNVFKPHPRFGLTVITDTAPSELKTHTVAFKDPCWRNNVDALQGFIK
ncbi:hypothetical protein ZIOFF_043736 [Zingiber officinale]|uniref:Uncharacterized protein n=1 Tax=Zingiber officinale TaxID=94328 RepID=A0A8J5FTW7_ZINOF|nr:hypothetical protein ZIOFF_043736 [Zingiber officinale]